MECLAVMHWLRSTMAWITTSSPGELANMRFRLSCERLQTLMMTTQPHRHRSRTDVRS